MRPRHDPIAKVAREKASPFDGQTPEQKAITDLGPGGRTDGERAAAWPAGQAAESPEARGGSSQGRSDRIPVGEGAVADVPSSTGDFDSDEPPTVDRTYPGHGSAVEGSE